MDADCDYAKRLPRELWQKILHHLVNLRDLMSVGRVNRGFRAVFTTSWSFWIENAKLRGFVTRADDPPKRHQADTPINWWLRHWVYFHRKPILPCPSGLPLEQQEEILDSATKEQLRSLKIIYRDPIASDWSFPLECNTGEERQRYQEWRALNDLYHFRANAEGQDDGAPPPKEPLDLLLDASQECPEIEEYYWRGTLGWNIYYVTPSRWKDPDTPWLLELNYRRYPRWILWASYLPIDRTQLWLGTDEPEFKHRKDEVAQQYYRYIGPSMHLEKIPDSNMLDYGFQSFSITSGLREDAANPLYRWQSSRLKLWLKLWFDYRSIQSLEGSHAHMMIVFYPLDPEPHHP